jgi:putative endonuclease
MPSSKKEASPKKKTVSVGREYEARAEAFYVQHGYEIIERNWRGGRKEIDLIVRKGQLVSFVEVKAAASERFGHPSEKVDAKKQAHLTEAAQRYIAEKEIAGVDLRFDVITFVKGKLEHFPNAFEATG